MIRVKLVILKDKQFFEEKEGSLCVVGKPLAVAQKLKDEGFELLHIIDTDALRGNTTNFDVYDRVTYILNVQVECAQLVHLIEKLLAVKIRVIISLPTPLDLKHFEKEKRLLVGKISADYEGNTAEVSDVLIENATPELIQKYKKSGKRIIVYKKDYNKQMEKSVFAVIG